MANLNGAYDVNDKPKSGAIPTGLYTAVIISSDMKTTKENTGQYLELEFQIISGDEKGRNVYTRLNLKNKNEMAERIARSDFAKIREATGVLAPQDSAQLHNIPMQIKVEFLPADESKNRKSDQNEIRDFKKLEGGGQQNAPFTPQAAQSAPAATQAPAASGGLPWARKQACLIKEYLQ